MTDVFCGKCYNAAGKLEARVVELEAALHALAEQASEMLERLDVVFDAERDAIAGAYLLVSDKSLVEAKNKP